MKSDLEDLISQGRYFEARSKAEEILKTSPHPRVKQLFALATSKLGMPELALEAIEAVYKQSPEDIESAGILGSIYKELFKKNQKTSFAVLSRDTYQKNFSVTQNYYTGINAASMSAMAGQAGKARETAAQVIVLMEKEPSDFWELATLGEAYLLIKNKAKSVEYYVQARQHAGNDWGKVTSVHNQLWLLNHYIPVPNEVMKLFAPPNVVAFSGHMIDQPGRSTPRFPQAIEPHVKDAIRHSIRTMNARIGYCSLACGSDILFVESMIEVGGEVNLLLPFDKEDFIKTSLTFAGNHWVDRFNAIVENHPVNYVTSGRYGGNDELFSLLSRVIYGSAILRSEAAHSEPNLLTVLSEMDLKIKEGGTRDTIGRWPYPQRHININPDIFSSGVSMVSTATAPRVEFEKTSDKVLFLVYVGLDGIATSEFYDIIDKFNAPDALRVVADKSNEKSFVVSFESDPGAMEFVAYVRETLKPYKQENLIKLALHVGSVSIVDHKLTGQAIDDLREIGSHVTAGAIYASEWFTSILAMNNQTYYLHYAGVITSKNDNTSRPFYNVELLR